MVTGTRGIITILVGMYSFQDCIHFLASVRKFHQEPIVILIAGVPAILHPLLKAFGNVTLKQAPYNNVNPVLASRMAKLVLYQESPFDKTIYMDCDICLLANINEVFDYLDEADILITKDVQPAISQATNLLRVKQEVLPVLQAVGLPLKEDSIQYNGGFIGFRRSDTADGLFKNIQKYFDVIVKNQDVLLLKDQGAIASAIEVVRPSMKILPPTYNYLSKWKELYETNEPVKVLHCTYPYRPQYAKNITRSIYTRIFDQFAKFILPNQVKNPWRIK